MEKRLSRNTTDSVVGGVASGLAEYFGISKVIVRVIWVALLLPIFPPGIIATLFLYIILWIALPVNTVGQYASVGIGFDDSSTPEPGITTPKEKNPKNTQILGYILLIVGGFLLLKQFSVWEEIQDYILPAIFIGLGAYVLLKQRDDQEAMKHNLNQPTSFSSDESTFKTETASTTAKDRPTDNLKDSTLPSNNDEPGKTEGSDEGDSIKVN